MGLVILGILLKPQAGLGNLVILLLLRLDKIRLTWECLGLSRLQYLLKYCRDVYTVPRVPQKLSRVRVIKQETSCFFSDCSFYKSKKGS